MRLLTIFCGFVLCLFLVQPAGAGDDSGTIGIQVVPISTGELSVLHVIEGSPASLNGLLPGDVVIEVDGFVMQGSDFDLVTRKYLWGQIGSTVSLTWLRPGREGSMQASLKRVAVDVVTVQPTPGVNIRTPK